MVGAIVCVKPLTYIPFLYCFSIEFSLYICLACHYVEGGIVAGHNNVSCPWETELIIVFLVELTFLCSDFLTTEIAWSLFSCLWTKSFVKSSGTL